MFVSEVEYEAKRFASHLVVGPPLEMYGNVLTALFEQIKAPSVGTVFGSLFSLWLVYGISIGIYRVYFSPIAKIPGPKVRVHCATASQSALTLQARGPDLLV